MCHLIPEVRIEFRSPNLMVRSVGLQRLLEQSSERARNDHDVRIAVGRTGELRVA
jgi:hypothetical protein